MNNKSKMYMAQQEATDFIHYKSNFIGNVVNFKTRHPPLCTPTKLAR